MREFTTSIAPFAQVFRLTKDAYLDAVKAHPDFHPVINDKSVWLAICPFCKNPTLIVDMDNPHGPIARHYLRKGLPVGKFNYEAALRCPRFTGERSKDAQYVPTEQERKEFLKSVREELLCRYDFWLTVLQETLGLYLMTERTASLILTSYMKENAFLRKFSNLLNFSPMLLLYGGRIPLHGRLVIQKSQLAQILRTIPNVELKDWRGSKKYKQIYFQPKVEKDVDLFLYARSDTFFKQVNFPDHIEETVSVAICKASNNSIGDDIAQMDVTFNTNQLMRCQKTFHPKNNLVELAKTFV